MNRIFLVPVTEMLDITKIKEYNQEFIKKYSNSWAPFVNYSGEFLNNIDLTTYDCKSMTSYSKKITREVKW